MDGSQDTKGLRDRATPAETETAAEEDTANMNEKMARSGDQQEANEPDTDEDEVLTPPKRRGRPRVDVFREPHPDYKPVPLFLRRRRALHQLDIWTDNYNRRGFERLVWRRRRREGHPDWELYKAAELAMAVMGRRAPERLDEMLDKKPWHRRDLHPFDKEAKLFITWLRNELGQNRDHVRGPKPEFLKLWKTAIALAVARYVVTAIGKRPYRQPPTAREIAQIWYVLFGEEEPHEAIRDRLVSVAEMCQQFARDGAYEIAGKKREYFRKAGDCVLKYSTQKSRRKRRGGGK